MKPIVTEEDKRLVGYLSKQSNKPKKIKVYYNKKSSDGTTKYLTGKYYSHKIKKEVTYRSSYELRFYHILDKDPSVVSYEVESVKIPYKDIDGSRRKYIPDVIVLYKNGDMCICEVKPDAMLEDSTVRLKEQAAINYFKTLLKGSKIICNFKFITEKDLFRNDSEYALFLKDNK